MEDGNATFELAINCDHSITCLIPPKYWRINDQHEVLNLASFGYPHEYKTHKAVLLSLVEHPRLIEKLNDDFVELLFVTIREEQKFVVASPKDATHVLVKLEYNFHSTYQDWLGDIAQTFYGSKYEQPSTQDVINFFYGKEGRAKFFPHSSDPATEHLNSIYNAVNGTEVVRQGD